MKTIGEIFGMTKHKGPVMGLEIELESDTALPVYRDPHPHPLLDKVGSKLPANWNAIKDGSLRGHSMEFVTRTPVFASVHKEVCIPALTDHLKTHKINHLSSRVSSHVHVNVTDLNYYQILNACVIWWALENCLVEWCGKARVGNNFCLRIKDATRQVLNVITDIKKTRAEGYNAFCHFNAEDSKYYALNLCRVRDIGTIEFRCFPGLDFNDTSKFNLWLKQIEHIMKMSLEYKNPKEIAQELDKLGASAFAKKFIIPEIASSVNPNLIEDNEIFVTQIGWCSVWPTEEKKKPVKKEKKVVQIDIDEPFMMNSFSQPMAIIDTWTQDNPE